MADIRTTNPSEELFHLSFSPNAKSTIVLIHGAFGSGADWSPVIPHLQPNYHLLVPDMPGHGQSAHLKPYSTLRAADFLAILIKTHAIDNQAHIVGASMGAKIAIALAERHPDAVSTCLVSGYGVYSPSPLAASWMPQMLWTMTRVENAVPRPLIRWLMDGADLGRATPDVELCRQVSGGEMSGNGQWPGAWPARTLIICAGKGGFPPTADRPQDAIKLAGIGRELNKATYAVTHPGMRHPWMLQDPALFADTVVAWIEEREISSGFVKL